MEKTEDYMPIYTKQRAGEKVQSLPHDYIYLLLIYYFRKPKRHQIKSLHMREPEQSRHKHFREGRLGIYPNKSTSLKKLTQLTSPESATKKT